MAETEKHEHALTQKALETLTKWGKDPTVDGGEILHFPFPVREPLATHSWGSEIAHPLPQRESAAPCTGSRSDLPRHRLHISTISVEVRLL